LKNVIQCPGLTPAAAEIRSLAQDVGKRLAVFSYKKVMPHFWVVFLGGTGTGKSSLFNAFCGENLSQTGVERPKTSGAIVYAYKGSPIEEDFPFPPMEIERRDMEGAHSLPTSGVAGRLLLFAHEREDWSHLVVVDTPDLDSVEPNNRQMAEDLYLLSDVVVFVASEEKYADEIPFRVLLKTVKDKKPYFFLLNKARDELNKEEVLETLQGQVNALDKERLWLIPYSPSKTFRSVSGNVGFRHCRDSLLSEFSSKRLRKETLLRQASDIEERLCRLLALLREENRSGQKWLNRLEALYKETCSGLIKEQQRVFLAESKEYLQTEIRKLFSRYDVLARPRKIVRETFLSVFWFLGLRRKKSRTTQKDALLKVRKKIDLSSVQGAIENFNRRVLEELSPEDETAPLFKKLREASVALTDQEVKERLWNEQDALEHWLEKRFRKLTKGIPRHKKVGIYSTSVLWGILILSLEIIVGGGFTVLDAALDSALAPFVTKGAVELFAYREIRKVTRELAQRYQKGLLSVVTFQRDLYAQCLESLMTPPETLASLEASLESVRQDLLVFSEDAQEPQYPSKISL
jgi:GTPase SAR1 family protein